MNSSMQKEKSACIDVYIKKLATFFQRKFIPGITFDNNVEIDPNIFFPAVRSASD